MAMPAWEIGLAAGSGTLALLLLLYCLWTRNSSAPSTDVETASSSASTTVQVITKPVSAPAAPTVLGRVRETAKMMVTAEAPEPVVAPRAPEPVVAPRAPVLGAAPRPPVAPRAPTVLGRVRETVNMMVTAEAPEPVVAPWAPQQAQRSFGTPVPLQQAQRRFGTPVPLQQAQQPVGTQRSNVQTRTSRSLPPTGLGRF